VAAQKIALELAPDQGDGNHLKYSIVSAK